MPTEEPPRRMIFHWKTYKALIAIILFLIFSILIQWCIVLYSVNLGVDDVTLIQYRFQLPNTDWTITIIISPLFHIIPLVVIVTLVSSWTYLTKHIAVRHNRKQIADSKPDKRRIEKLEDRKIGRLKARIRDFTENLKSKLMKTQSIAYLWRKIHFARATIKSALMVLSVFAAFIFMISLLAYPQIIYLAVKGIYQTNVILRNFMTSIGSLGTEIASLPLLNSAHSIINNGLLFIAPGFGDFVSQLGGLIEPLAKLHSSGKYLIFQNAAAWISALIALFYGKHKQKPYRPKRKR